MVESHSFVISPSYLFCVPDDVNLLHILSASKEIHLEGDALFNLAAFWRVHVPKSIKDNLNAIIFFTAVERLTIARAWNTITPDEYSVLNSLR
jgi:hypothetical protein